MSLEDQFKSNKEQPIINKRAELESKKDKLELIYNSLLLVSNNMKDIGKGMKEYSNDVKNSNKKIDDEQNNSFNNQSNVNEIKKDNDELERSDAQLVSHLKELGVVIEGDFSYENIEKILENKIQSLEKEIIQERIKNTEGREEVINELCQIISNSFLKNLGPCNFFREYCDLSIDGGGGRAVVLQNYSSRIDRLPFLGDKSDKEIENINKKYGRDIFLEASGKAFSDKFDLTEKVDNYKETWPKDLSWDISRVKKIFVEIFVDIIKFKILNKELEENNELSERLKKEEIKLHKFALQETKEFEKNIESAKDLLSEIDQKKSMISNKGKVERKNSYLEITFSDEEADYAQQIALVDQNERNSNEKLVKLSYKEPMIWGKEKWEAQMSLLRLELKELRDKKDDLYNELEKVKKANPPFFNLDRFKGTEIGIYLQNLDMLGKTPEEVFDEIKNKCNEIANKEAPELILKLKEYLELNNNLVYKR